jgi:hypothetical protein
VGTQDPIPLAPGRHVVTATAGGAAPFRSEIALAEGAQVALTVTLQPPAAAQPMESSPPPPQSQPPPEKDTLAPVRWLTVGGGVGLMAVSAVLLVARHNDISDLNKACTPNFCPTDQKSELESTRQQALVLGPAGVACGVAGVALAGAGIYWIVTAHRPAATGQAVSVVPTIGLGSAGVALTGPLQ